MRRKSLLWGAMALGFVACTAPEQAFVTDVKCFDAAHPAIIRMHHTQPDTSGELRIFMRTDDRFTEDSLTVRIDSFSPDSLRCTEYHRLVFRRGHRINAIKSIVEIPYRRQVVLKEAGNYYFTLTPTRPVAGIEAVGMLYRAN